MAGPSLEQHGTTFVMDQNPNFPTRNYFLGVIQAMA
ncbi:uncharacterized protein METZ01_LOCUS462076, partial [marine metagenome]